MEISCKLCFSYTSLPKFENRPYFFIKAVLCFGDRKQEAALLPPSRQFALLHNLHLCLAHADLPVHVIHSICCKVETLDLGVTCFESTRETWGGTEGVIFAGKCLYIKACTRHMHTYIDIKYAIDCFHELTTSCDIRWPGRS